jgi:hypothetical protein
MSELVPFLAPLPDGYNCAQPDYSVPLPGQVVHWPQTPGPANLPPLGLFSDPWDKPSTRDSSCRRNTLPPIPIYDGTNALPVIF